MKNTDNFIEIDLCERSVLTLNRGNQRNKKKSSELRYYYSPKNTQNQLLFFFSSFCWNKKKTFIGWRSVQFRQNDGHLQFKYIGKCLLRSKWLLLSFDEKKKIKKICFQNLHIKTAPTTLISRLLSFILFWNVFFMFF